MIKDIALIGDKIEIKKLNNQADGSKNQAAYVSQLLDFFDEYVIHIAMPIEGGRITLLELGHSYNLCFYTEKGLYQSNCIVVKRLREQNIYSAVVQLTTKPVKVQRRQYFRLECMKDIQYHLVIQQESNEQEKEPQWMKATMTDVSGGGAKFHSETLHQKGDECIIKVELEVSGKRKKYELNADIISSSRVSPFYTSFEHRVKFNNISRNEREDIIKYIFEQERLRRKGGK